LSNFTFFLPPSLNTFNVAVFIATIVILIPMH
jgi:hypothetical protein